MNKLAIIGDGGFGREVAWVVERINRVKPTWELLGFIDDKKPDSGLIGGYPVLGDCNWLVEQQDEIYVVCAIGASKLRKKVIKKLHGLKFATLIDPSAILSDRVEIGEGCIICAGTIITVDIKINSHVIINLDCTIGHDVILEDYVTLYPSVNVSGNVVLEESVEVGTGSHILQGLQIGENTIIGAGAVVVKDIKQCGTYVGVPVRKLA